MNPDYKEIGKNIRLMRIRHGISPVSYTHLTLPTIRLV